MFGTPSPRSAPTARLHGTPSRPGPRLRHAWATSPSPRSSPTARLGDLALAYAGSPSAKAMQYRHYAISTTIQHMRMPRRGRISKIRDFREPGLSPRARLLHCPKLKKH